jgi:hypothetical protein
VICNKGCVHIFFRLMMVSESELYKMISLFLFCKAENFP